MHIAHIIMVHKDPEQLLRLLKKLEHPKFDIYIHLDKKIAIDDFKKIKAHTNAVFIKNRVNCNWGGHSVFQAIINSLNEVISSKKKYDFINLISGQDYPLASPSQIYKYLESNPERNFISFETSETSKWIQECSKRYESYHFTDLKLKGKYFLQKIINKITPPRKIPFDGKLYGSSKSTWWTLSGACCEFVLETLENNRALKRFLKYTWVPDEFVITSLILNSPFKETVINNNLRYIDWSEGKAHPKLLSHKDFEKIRRSGMLFARKFDSNNDSLIMDQIDSKLLSTEKSHV